MSREAVPMCGDAALPISCRRLVRSRTAVGQSPVPTAVLTGLLLLVSVAAEARDAKVPTALIEQVASNRSTAFVIDREAYAAADISDLPIGVFDSGIGGLTVLDAILRLDEFNNQTHEPGADGVPDFTNEKFIYFGDQANMPYGNYSSAGREDFLREIIIEDALFLLGRNYWTAPDAPKPSTDKPPVKAVVIACNTATAYGIEDVRMALGMWKVPVILVGVVEAGAEGAVTALKAQPNRGAVAVMATVGTCRSQAYPRTIERFARKEGAKAPKIVQQGSVGLAGAIEGDPAFVRPAGAASPVASDYHGPAVDNKAAPLNPALRGQYAFDPAHLIGDPNVPATWRLDSVDNYVHYDVATLVDAYAKQKPAAPLSTVVLGCTHFPFVREKIAASFARLRDFHDANGKQPYEKVIASDITFVDPAALTARELYVALRAKNRLLGAGKTSRASRNTFFISKPNPNIAEVKLAKDGGFDPAYKYGRRPGKFEQDTVRRVPLRPTDLTPAIQGLLRTSMPAVWKGLAAAP